jgi:hypothetical protein
VNSREPAIIAAAIATIINAIVLLVFKEELDLEVQTAIITVVTLVAGWIIRSKVTPVA